MDTIKVIVVDDSALMRKVLSEILNRDEGIEVIATAGDPFIARDKIKSLNPDVITLDIEMPRMDGLTFLKNVMRLRPMPVVMISTLTEQGADATLQALEIGAVDFVTKPKVDSKAGLSAQADVIIQKVKAAAQARVRPLAEVKSPSPSPTPVRPAGPSATSTASRPPAKIIAIGASTGGTEAIRQVLEPLQAGLPPIVIAQHIPPMFSASFAQRLDGLCEISVSEAEDGVVLQRGHAYVAPGDAHFFIEARGHEYIGRLNRAPPVNRHRPSVDVLFRSVKQHVGRHVVGALLTGMGDDGAKGLKLMRDAGAHTIAQDEATSVVWGMPKEAVKLGGAEEVLPLHEISARIVDAVQGRVRASSNRAAARR